MAPKKQTPTKSSSKSVTKAVGKPILMAKKSKTTRESIVDIRKAFLSKERRQMLNFTFTKTIDMNFALPVGLDLRDKSKIDGWSCKWGKLRVWHKGAKEAVIYESVLKEAANDAIEDNDWLKWPADLYDSELEKQLSDDEVLEKVIITEDSIRNNLKHFIEIDQEAQEQEEAAAPKKKGKKAGTTKKTSKSFSEEPVAEEPCEICNKTAVVMNHSIPAAPNGLTEALPFHFCYECCFYDDKDVLRVEHPSRGLMALQDICLECDFPTNDCECD